MPRDTQQGAQTQLGRGWGQKGEALRGLQGRKNKQGLVPSVLKFQSMAASLS